MSATVHSLREASDPPSVLGIAFYSHDYPAVGETHGLSTVLGVVRRLLPEHEILAHDLVASSTSDAEAVAGLLSERDHEFILISLTYGTYSVLHSLRATIQKILDRGTPVVIGGALATYLAQEILQNIDRRITVVCGEGEPALHRLLSTAETSTTLNRAIPNTVRMIDGQLVSGPRQLTKEEEFTAPYRGHLSQLLNTKAQIFVESSRGCSWAACSFCLRGLLDITGHRSEYRRLPRERIQADVSVLIQEGVEFFTFADEDFLGGSAHELSDFIDWWVEWLSNRPTMGASPVHYDVSATIGSINLVDHSRLLTLRENGLRKVFLGIESGSPAQLRRYHKGHSPEAAERAALRILNAGLQLEVGFIMFDPLMTLDEVRENADFLVATGIGQYVSGPTSELRLQKDSRYLRLLRGNESHVIQGPLDLNTLTFPVRYQDPPVERLVGVVREVNRLTHGLFYSLKGLTRFAGGAILGESAPQVLRMLASYRESLLRALRDAASGAIDEYRKTCANETAELAQNFLRSVDSSKVDHPIFLRARQEAEAWRRNSGSSD